MCEPREKHRKLNDFAKALEQIAAQVKLRDVRAKFCDGFAIFAPVHWPAVLAMGLGCLLGARLGPVVVRRAPATPLRLLIAVAGLALAIKLGFDAYSS